MSSFYHNQSLLDSSRRVLEQSCPPSLREILGAYKSSKGQDGDCQLLIAVLNAQSAENQRLAAVAQLHTTMLQYEHGIPPSPSTSYSFPQLHIPSNYSSPRSRSPEMADRMPRRTSRSSRHRTPYERPGPIESHERSSPRHRGPPSPSSSSSSTSSPRAREAMSIDTLLSPKDDRS